MYPNANSSRHHFPTNSILFESVPDFRAPLSAMQHNPTLVNVAEAADLEATALPSIPSYSAVSANHAAFTKHVKKKKSRLWSRIWAKLTNVKSKKKERKEGVWHDEGDNVGVKVKKMEIGEPTHFRHERTGGALGLRVEEEDEWEDVEETRGGRGFRQG